LPHASINDGRQGCADALYLRLGDHAAEYAAEYLPLPPAV
jgi:hypothetical protein